ncbi:MAG: hypothetical protein GKR99_05255 [Rhodobacteraceae bacterium]|nr:hypothetical protein [Paracoccaceae bacterium]
MTDGAARMPVYCINLAERTDRWEHMVAAAGDCGVPLIRIEACNVDDAQAFQPEVHEAPDHTRPVIHPAEVACTMSHRQAWRQLLESGAPAGVVLEDDVVFAPGFTDVLHADWVPSFADVIRIEVFNSTAMLEKMRRLPGHNRQIGRLKSSQSGTGGYVITRKAAERLLADDSRITRPIDWILFSRRSPWFRRLSIWQMIPAPVTQGGLLPDSETGSWSRSTLKVDRVRNAREWKARGDDQKAVSRDRPNTLRRRLARNLRRVWQRLTGRRKVSVEFG